MKRQLAIIVSLLLSTIGTQAVDEFIHIAIVACGAARSVELLASVKSSLLAARHPERYFFHLFHSKDDGNSVFIANVLSQWNKVIQFSFEVLESRIPSNYSSLFAPCACQRLFLHEILSTDKVIYLDSDTLVFGDLSELWERELDVAAMVAEHPSTFASPYYSNRTKHPFFNSTEVNGLNSGVMVISLKRLRRQPWNEELEGYRLQYDLQFHDQDLLNIYFAHHPSQLTVLSCKWNYRADHCFWERHHCNDESNRIGILHGSRGSFHKMQDYEWAIVAFSMVFEAFKGWSIGTACEIQALVQTKVLQWMNGVNQESLTNNCHAHALPRIIQAMASNCHRERSIV